MSDVEPSFNELVTQLIERERERERALSTRARRGPDGGGAQLHVCLVTASLSRTTVPYVLQDLCDQIRMLCILPTSWACQSSHVSTSVSPTRQASSSPPKHSFCRLTPHKSHSNFVYLVQLSIHDFSQVGNERATDTAPEKGRDSFALTFIFRILRAGSTRPD